MDSTLPVDDALREPKRNRLLGFLSTVTSVNEVPVNVNGKVSTNGSSLGGSRVGESNDLVTGDSGVLTLPNHGNHWPRCNILDQGRIKGLFGMFSVELLSEGTLHLDQLQGFEEESFLLKPADDVSNKAALKAIGLDHDEGVFGVGHGDESAEDHDAAHQSDFPVVAK